MKQLIKDRKIVPDLQESLVVFACRVEKRHLDGRKALITAYSVLTGSVLKFV